MSDREQELYDALCKLIVAVDWEVTFLLDHAIDLDDEEMQRRCRILLDCNNEARAMWGKQNVE